MARLASVARAENAALQCVLLAGFAALLARMATAEALVIGMHIAGRDFGGSESVIGPFADILPLPVEIGAQQTARELIRSIQNSFSSGLSHHGLPFERLMDEIGTVRAPGIPLTPQITFAWHSSRPILTLSNLVVRSEPLRSSETRSELALELTASRSGGASGHFTYNDELFDRKTIRRWRNYFNRLLEGIASQPDSPITSIPVLTDSEKARELEGSNQAGAALPSVCLSDFLDRQATATPNEPALLSDDECITYAELHAEAERLGRALAAQAIGPEDIVGVCLSRPSDLIRVILGVLKAGAAFLPLEPSHPAQRRRWMLENSGAKLLVTDSTLVVDFDTEQHVSQRPQLLILDDAETAATLANLPAGPLADDERTKPLKPDSLAYVIYTSGSTGNPKGVAIEGRSVVNLALGQAEIFAIGPGKRVLQFASPSFDAAVWEVVMALSSGAALIVVSRGRLHDPHGLGKVIKDFRVTHATLPPALLPLLSPDKLAGLEVLIVAGETCPPALVERFAIGRLMYNAYGPTEGTVCTTVSKPLDAKKDGTEALGPVTIGSPIRNIQCYVLDAALEPVPPGVLGELWISGVNLARGYLGRPDLTAERFVPCPFGHPGLRMYRTGDVVRRRADGALEYHGRVDQQVKISGMRIELTEVEAAIIEIAPAVIDRVAVLARPGRNGVQQLVAFVVPRSGFVMPAPVTIRASLALRLPRTMIPASVIQVGELPLTSNGKLDRQALLSKESQPQNVQAWKPSAMPRGRNEALLCRLFEEVTGFRPVSIYDHFVEIGGDSIGAIQLANRAYDEGLIISVRDLFVHQSPVKLAAIAVPTGQTSRDDRGPEAPREKTSLPSPRRRKNAESTQAKQGAPVTETILPSRVERRLPGALAIEQVLPLTPEQHRMALASHNSTGRDPFLIQFALKLQGRLDRTVLRAAWISLSAMEFTLRLALPPEAVESGHGVLLCDDRSALNWSELEFSSPEALESWFSADRKLPFDFESTPPLRIALLRLSDREHWLAFTLHHALLDGWSAMLLVSELGSLYRTLLGYATAATMPKASTWLSHLSWLAGRDRETAIHFWQNHLAGLDRSAYRIAPGHTRRSRALEEPGEVSLLLEAELIASLTLWAQCQRVTLSQLLLAAFALTLIDSVGASETVVGVVRSGRSGTPKAANGIGLFIETSPLRISAPRDSSVGHWLQQIQAVSAEAETHGHLGLPAIQSLVAGSEGEELFDALFVHENFLWDDNEVAFSDDLRLTDIRQYDGPNYPLELFVARQSKDWRLKLAYIPDAVSPELARDVIERMVRWLRELPGQWADTLPHKSL